jgi:lipopolysaccharide/colanic/teichoic acid biosynthesis glycosyltransferase
VSQGAVQLEEAPVQQLAASPEVAREIPSGLRILDLVLVALLAPFALIACALVAVAVAIDSPGPIIYRSRRVGRGGKPFAMLKFRTMGRDATGPPVSAAGDVRYTPLGRTLARSRLDELPQLLNVVRGDMRLVGPRPEVEDFVREFPDEYEQILSVPPGLTGPAQVEYAWEGEVLARAQAVDRARVYRESILPYKLAIDLRYARDHSVAGDLVLLGRTLLLPGVRILRRLDAALGGDRSMARVIPLVLIVAAVATLVALAAAESAAPF